MFLPLAHRPLSAVLLWFRNFLCLLYDELFHAGILLTNPLGEIARSVLEQHDEAKSENDEDGEPEEPAQQCHEKRVAGADGAINSARSTTS